MLPKPIYEMQPFGYLTSGIVLISFAQESLMLIGGILFFISGAVVLIMRSSVRRVTSPYPPLATLLVIPEMFYEILPFLYVLTGLLVMKYSPDFSNNLTVVIIAGILISVGVLRLFQRSFYRHPNFFTTKHRTKVSFFQ